jgi:hypothetical protein
MIEINQNGTPSFGQKHLADKHLVFYFKRALANTPCKMAGLFLDLG